MNGREAALADAFPGGRLSERAHQKLAQLQERMDSQKSDLSPANSDPPPTPSKDENAA